MKNKIIDKMFQLNAEIIKVSEFTKYSDNYSTLSTTNYENGIKTMTETATINDHKFIETDVKSFTKDSFIIGHHSKLAKMKKYDYIEYSQNDIVETIQNGDKYSRNVVSEQTKLIDESDKYIMYKTTVDDRNSEDEINNYIYNIYKYNSNDRYTISVQSNDNSYLVYTDQIQIEAYEENSDIIISIDGYHPQDVSTCMTIFYSSRYDGKQTDYLFKCIMVDSEELVGLLNVLMNGSNNLKYILPTLKSILNICTLKSIIKDHEPDIIDEYNFIKEEYNDEYGYDEINISIKTNIATSTVTIEGDGDDYEEMKIITEYKLTVEAVNELVEFIRNSKGETEMYKVENIFEYRGYTGVVIFTSTGHRCGYVCIPKSHKLFNVDYDSIADYELGVELTYLKNISPIDSETKEDEWWIGFDFGHYNDLRDIDALKSYFPNNLDDIKFAERCNNNIKNFGYVNANTSQTDAENAIKEIINSLYRYGFTLE